MNTTTRIGHISCLLALLGVVACGDRGGGTDTSEQSGHAAGESTGTTSQAFTNGWWSETVFGPADIDTGLSPSSWTCFLSGAGEELISGKYLGNGPEGFIGARIDARTHTWHMLSQFGAAQGIPPAAPVANWGPSVAIMCVPAPMAVPIKNYVNLPYGPEFKSTGPVSLNTAPDPHLMCGLTAIFADNETTGNNFPWAVNGGVNKDGTLSGDSAWVQDNNGLWVLNGSGVSEASATCVDFSENWGGWTWFGNTTENLLQVDINQVQCWLSGIGGNFNSTYPVNNQDGVFLGYSFPSKTWSVTFDGGKSNRVLCGK
jgi:hypothetical protein